jgi:hypothetical protein
MGFFSFWKKVFSGESDKEEAELDAARARHGIKVDKAEMNKPRTETERFAENYDPWEEVRNYRLNFFIGNWAARKFRIVGEEKLKKKLAELEKKREEEERKKLGE